MPYVPVHKIENVDGDPLRIRTLCGEFEWTARAGTGLIDSSNWGRHAVTCPGCLRVMEERTKRE